ncbi:hypothetical protein EDD85DRAFT_890025 [Armillaria nabsnona]|nr:hypothetical protein EDD85DRAFT_890025 [Armillaria nabsnona]
MRNVTPPQRSIRSVEGRSLGEGRLWVSWDAYGEDKKACRWWYRLPICQGWGGRGREAVCAVFNPRFLRAYKPRWFVSTVLWAPKDSIRIFEDMKVKKATAMRSS